MYDMKFQPLNEIDKMLCDGVKEIVSRDWGALLMFLLGRYIVLDIPGSGLFLILKQHHRPYASQEVGGGNMMPPSRTF
jgi:hypothetical protein